MKLFEIFQMKKQRTFKVCLLMVALSLSVGTFYLQGATTLTVCVSGCDFFRIQKAIDAASVGDTIQIGTATYRENLSITKSLILVGKGEDRENVRILGIERERAVIGIESEEEIEVTFENLTVAEAKLDDGIDSRGKAKVALINVQVSGNGNDGLLVGGSVTLTNSTVSGNGHYGLVVAGQVTLTNTTVSDNKFIGLRVVGSGQATLTNSTISGNGDKGLVVEDSAQATLINSTVSDNGTGLFVVDSALLEVRDNAIEENQGCGIFSSSTQLVQGAGNRMRDNGNDLCGNLFGELRVPLRPETESEILFSSAEFSSLQEAVDALEPGGTLLLAPGSVQVGGVTIAKPLVIRVSGADEGKAATVQGRTDRTRVLSLIEGAKVEIEGLRITQGNTGVRLGSNAQVTLTNSTVYGNGHYGLVVGDSAQATLINSTVSGNPFAGLFVFGSAQATLTDSSVLDDIEVEDSGQVALTNSTISRSSLELTHSAQATLTNSTISDNEFGFGDALIVNGSAQVTLTNSTISNNKGNGLVMVGPGRATLINSTISNNGGNGLFVKGSAQATLINSIVKDNINWGIVAKLERCGFDEDDFTGLVFFEGTNTVEGNNTSGDQDGLGNPGEHPFKDLPDGQVCLP